MIKLKRLLSESNNTNLMSGYKNTFWQVISPFNVFVITGAKASNSLYGSARIQEPVWTKIQLKKGDELHALQGGDFLVTANKKVYPSPRLKVPEFAPFERNSSYDRFPMDKLKQLTTNQAMDVSYNIHTYDSLNKPGSGVYL